MSGGSSRRYPPELRERSRRRRGNRRRNRRGRRHAWLFGHGGTGGIGVGPAATAGGCSATADMAALAESVAAVGGAGGIGGGTGGAGVTRGCSATGEPAVSVSGREDPTDRARGPDDAARRGRRFTGARLGPPEIERDETRARAPQKFRKGPASGAPRPRTPQIERVGPTTPPDEGGGLREPVWAHPKSKGTIARNASAGRGTCQAEMPTERSISGWAPCQPTSGTAQITLTGVAKNKGPRVIRYDRP